LIIIIIIIINTVFRSNHWAFCATVELSYNLFLLKLNDLHIYTYVPATWKRCQ